MKKNNSITATVKLGKEIEAACDKIIATQRFEDTGIIAISDKTYNKNQTRTLEAFTRARQSKEREVNNTLFKAHVDLFITLNNLDYHLATIKETKGVTQDMHRAIRRTITMVQEQIKDCEKNIQQQNSQNNEKNGAWHSDFIAKYYNQHYLEYAYKAPTEDGQNPQKILANYCTDLSMGIVNITMTKILHSQLMLSNLYNIQKINPAHGPNLGVAARKIKEDLLKTGQWGDLPTKVLLQICNVIEIYPQKNVQKIPSRRPSP